MWQKEGTFTFNMGLIHHFMIILLFHQSSGGLMSLNLNGFVFFVIVFNIALSLLIIQAWAWGDRNQELQN